MHYHGNPLRRLDQHNSSIKVTVPVLRAEQSVLSGELLESFLIF